MWKTLEKVNGATGRVAERRLQRIKWERLVSWATEAALKTERRTWFRSCLWGLWGFVTDTVRSWEGNAKRVIVISAHSTGWRRWGWCWQRCEMDKHRNLPVTERSWVCWLTSRRTQRGPAERLSEREREGACWEFGLRVGDLGIMRGNGVSLCFGCCREVGVILWLAKFIIHSWKCTGWVMFGHFCCRDIVHVFVCVQRRLRNEWSCLCLVWAALPDASVLWNHFCWAREHHGLALQGRKHQQQHSLPGGQARFQLLEPLSFLSHPFWSRADKAGRRDTHLGYSYCHHSWALADWEVEKDVVRSGTRVCHCNSPCGRTSG